MPAFRIRARAPRGSASGPAFETNPEILQAFLEDAAHHAGGHAVSIAFPTTEAEVVAAVHASRRILPIGAQSSLTGGATPDGDTLLGFARMNRIVEIDRARVRVEPGVPLQTLQETLDQHGLWYPPVPTFAGAFVGGTVATNAAGAATFKYGSTRAWVEALTVVLASGDVLDLSRGEVVASPEGRFEIDTDHGPNRRQGPHLHDAGRAQAIGRLPCGAWHGSGRSVRRLGRHAGHRHGNHAARGGRRPGQMSGAGACVE